MAAHYHIWHHDLLEGQPAFATARIPIPTIKNPKRRRPLTVQSLRNDLAKLRADGAAKGIADSSRVQIGVSRHLRDIWALRLGKPSEHRVLVTGGVHAKEWLSVEIPFLAAKYLVDNYSQTPMQDEGEGLAPLEVRMRIKHLLENREIWFVPLLNPDGHMWTMTSSRLWRSNRSSYYYPEGGEVDVTDHLTRAVRKEQFGPGSYGGVDINRNMPTSDWGEETYTDKTDEETGKVERTVRSSPDPRTAVRQIWAGPERASEVETQAVCDLVGKQLFRASISFHSYGKYLAYSQRAAQVAYLKDVGQGMARVMRTPESPTPDYEFVCGDTAMYPITGHIADYCLEKVSGQPAFTCELAPADRDVSDSDLAFNGLPAAAIEPAFREVLPGVLALINSAGFSAPAASRTIRAGAATRTVQVVRNCWQVFADWPNP